MRAKAPSREKVPDVGAVLADGAVAGEGAGVGNVYQAFARKGFPILRVVAVRTQTRVAIGEKILKQEIVIG